MSFFDDSHVTDVGLQGSAGPSVSFLDMVQQSFRQQFRVDSARALDAELRNRWLESLRQLNNSGAGQFSEPLDPLTYRAFAEFTRGQPVTALSGTTTTGQGYGARFVEGDPTQNENFRQMQRANEAIRALNNPNIRSFEQILEEVSQMQREVEEETASMSERSSAVGGTLGSLIGAIGGSFTTRDPLNIVTATWGAGRTVATRIASEMGIAAAVTGATELGDVQPARALADLPERSALFNIAAASIGAGLIRGGIEGAGYGIRRLRGEDIDIDARDSQLQQMFEANSDRPSARAGAMVLDDTLFLERNNPFGESRAAQERFIAELTEVQRAMNGAPMTAIGRVMPPVPFEYIQKAADFEIVREQAPLLYARMEQAQAAVQASNEPRPVLEGEGPALSPNGLFREGQRHNNEVFLTYQPSLSETSIPIHLKISDEGIAEISVDQFSDLSNRIGPAKVREAMNELIEMYPEIRGFEGLRNSGANPGRVQKVNATRRAANKEYEAAYRAVEAESVRLREKAARAETAQQGEASNVLVRAMEGRPFVGPLLRYDNIESVVDRINKINDTLDEDTLARFQRETIGEGEDAIELEVWERDGGIDIGLRDPVDPNFRFVTDEGEMTVAAAMRDLQDDVDLVEAIKVCAI